MFVNQSHFNSSLIFSIPLTARLFRAGSKSCPQVLDLGGSDWQWKTLGHWVNWARKKLHRTDPVVTSSEHNEHKWFSVRLMMGSCVSWSQSYKSFWDPIWLDRNHKIWHNLWVRRFIVLGLDLIDEAKIINLINFTSRGQSYKTFWPLRCSTKDRPLASPAYIRLGWNGFLGTNNSLLRKFVNYSRKKFYRIGPEAKVTWWIEKIRAVIYDLSKMLQNFFLP